MDRPPQKIIKKIIKNIIRSHWVFFAAESARCRHTHTHTEREREREREREDGTRMCFFPFMILKKCILFVKKKV